MDPINFLKTTNIFRNKKLRRVRNLREELEPLIADYCLLQQHRCITSALVWATQELLEKYGINKENNEDENE